MLKWSSKRDEIYRMLFIDVDLFKSSNYLVYVWKCLFLYFNEDKHTSKCVCLSQRMCGKELYLSVDVECRTKAIKMGRK